MTVVVSRKRDAVIERWRAHDDRSDGASPRADADLERPTLIGLSGFTGAGKRSVTDILVGHGYNAVDFDDKVLELSVRLLSGRADGPGIEQVREAAEAVLGAQVWIDATLPKVSTPFGRSPLSAAKPLVVRHVRTASEARRIRNLGGVIWRVIRPGGRPADRAEQRQVDGLRPDATVCNTGTLADLHSVVRLMLQPWEPFEP
jgi:hypothetical protein